MKEAALLILASVRVLLVLMAVISFMGIAIQILDEGGGRSGTHAVSQVTTLDRLRDGFVNGLLGVSFSAAAVYLSPKRFQKDRTKTL